LSGHPRRCPSPMEPVSSSVAGATLASGTLRRLEVCVRSQRDGRESEAPRRAPHSTIDERTVIALAASGVDREKWTRHRCSRARCGSRGAAPVPAPRLLDAACASACRTAAENRPTDACKVDHVPSDRRSPERR
jgi:hypothetical protein